MLGFRLRSHKMGTVPYFVNHARFAFKRFFHLLAFACALKKLMYKSSGYNRVFIDYFPYKME